ncbi:MAG: hypothetical protein KDB27_06780 [Planctomycetales bacterium]|nr:hypothetical protein [Planctomycetales bacterium]
MPRNTRRSAKTYRPVLAIALLATMAIATSLSTTVFAQSSRESRRQFVDELLQTLIDSRQDERDERQPPNVDRPNRATTSRSNRTSATPATASRNTSRVSSSSKLRDIHDNVQSMSQDLSALVAQLDSDSDRTPGLRALLSDALSASAATTLLRRQCENARSTAEISNDYEQVDREWRLLAFRLLETRDLSSRARSYVDRINGTNNRLGQLMGMQPQFDRSQLSREVNTLTGALRNLLDDIDTDVDDQNLRYSLINEGQRVYAQGRAMNRRLFENGSYADVKADYEEFRRRWNPFANQVRDLNYPYVARQLRRVHNADRNVQELLWVSGEMNRSELTYIAQSLRSDTNELMESISLKQLAQIDGNRDRLIEYAATFSTTCSDFAELVRNGDEKDTLTDVYYYLADDWKRFGNSIRGIDTRTARQKHREIARSVVELRDILGIRPNFDFRKGTESAAQLENLATYYDRNLQQMLSQGGRYSSDFRQRATRASSDFLKTSQSLHANLSRGQNVRVLREQSNQLSKEWETLMSLASRIPDDRNRTLNTLRRRMTPLLVDLQTTLTR